MCPRHYELIKHDKHGIRIVIFSIEQKLIELKALQVSLETLKKQLGDIL
jgi:hypothetical protein